MPKEIILQNWQGQEDIILLTKEAVSYISQAVGSKNVGKLLSAVKNIFKKGEENLKGQRFAQLEKEEKQQHNLT